MARNRKYSLEKGGPKNLTIEWTGIWKNTEVLLDGQRLGEPIPTMKDLKQGRTFTLPDGRSLSVQFKQQVFGAQGLEVLLDGRPLPGSDTDPRARLKLATGVLYFVAGLSALVGILAMTGVKFLQMIGFGWPSLAAGVLLAALAFIGYKQRAPWAFITATALMVIDTIVSLTISMQGGGRIQPSGMFLRVALIVAVAGGIKAAIEAKKADRDDVTDAFK